MAQTINAGTTHCSVCVSSKNGVNFVHPLLTYIVCGSVYGGILNLN